MELTFDTRGNDKQKECARLWCDNSVTEILYGGAKMGGKSFLGCSLIFGDALTYPETYYFIARQNLTDLVRFTVPSIHEVLNAWGVDSSQYVTYNGAYHYFELYNGSRVYLIEASYRPSDPLYMRFGSMQMTRGWIEEAGEFCRAAKSNLMATLGRKNNERYDLSIKLLQTCNPSNNYLYSDYYKLYRDGTLPSHIRFIQAFISDNKTATQEYIENLRQALTPAERERLLYGRWEFDTDTRLLVDYDAVCDAFTNDFVNEGDPYISADLAGGGRDTCVIALWHGDVCRFPFVKNKTGGKDIETAIQRIATENNVPRSHIVADADGLGFFLESYMRGIKEFRGGSKAIHDTYASLKAECAYRLAEKINKRQIRIDCPPEYAERIRTELMQLKAADVNTDNKRALIKKEEMKQALGHSPDFLDTLIMRQFFDIHDKAEGARFSPLQIPKKR